MYPAIDYYPENTAKLEARRFVIVLRGVLLILIGVIFLQRLGYVTGGDSSSDVPLSIPLTYLALFVFWTSGRVYIHMTRLGLFFLMMTSLIVTLFIDPKPFSPLSLIYMFVCYLPYIFVCPCSEEEYQRVLRLYNDCMIVIAVIAIMQFAIYMQNGERTKFFEAIFPEQFITHGYNTGAKLSYELALQRPNAEFFLEPSFVSQFLAISVLIELVWFRRQWRMALYGLGILASLSGTGMLLLIFFASVIAIQKKQYHLVIAGAVVFAILKSLPPDTAFGFLASRTDEINAEGSSAYERFVGPLIVIPYLLGNEFIHWLVGFGPGSAKGFDSGIDFNPFAFSKLMLEYGVIGTLCSMWFLTYCFLTDKFNLTFAAGLFFMYNLLSGSLLQPHTVFLFVALAILFVPRIQDADPRLG